MLDCGKFLILGEYIIICYMPRTYSVLTDCNIKNPKRINRAKISIHELVALFIPSNC